MAPVVHECVERKVPYILVHTNQHYSDCLDKIFFHELAVPAPTHNLGVGSGSLSAQTAKILARMGELLEKETPRVVVVQGDTNTAFACALAASHAQIPIAHVEAGLRSYDRRMPEETNRTLIDHMATYLFAVSHLQRDILLGEGIAARSVHVVGNTVADSVHRALSSTGHAEVLARFGVRRGGYLVVTMHRPENVDTRHPLEQVLRVLAGIAAATGVPLLLPLHPRTGKKLEEFGLALPDAVRPIPPVGYTDFLCLLSGATAIVTDSGGVQEEASLVGTPCVTLRLSTERPETVNSGANVIVGHDREAAVAAVGRAVDGLWPKWSDVLPRGAARKIMNVLAPPRTSTAGPSVTVVGLGYIGLPMACLLARGGCVVTGVDVDAERRALVARGEVPFSEPGLSEILREVVGAGRLRVRDAPGKTAFYVIAVPTPHRNGVCDLSCVVSACRDVADVCRPGDTVVVESTIAPGTCAKLQEHLPRGIRIAYCSERAIPGSTLHEMIHNDRIIGFGDGCREEANDLLALYRTFVRGEVLLTSLRTAECVKLVENASRDVGIALANEFSQVLDELGADAVDVIRLANHHPRVNILSPGAGVGGHCIPVDSHFLVQATTAGTLLRTARRVNEEQPRILARKVLAVARDRQLADAPPLRVGIMGVAYKPNVDDTRESPAKSVLATLVEAGCQVRFHDPLVMAWQELRSAASPGKLDGWAHILVIVTEHHEYEEWQSSTAVLVDNLGRIRSDPKT